MSMLFKKFRVIPRFGAFSATIEFELTEGFTGDLYFYRSLSGTTDWVLLNPEAPVSAASGTFADTNLDAGFLTTPFYCGVLDPAGGGPETWIKGSVVAPYDFLTNLQRRRISAIVRREYRLMSGNKSGMRVLHLVPRDSGDAAYYYDAQTGQILGPGCGGSDSYGKPFAGGYYPPVQTWALLFSADPRDKREGTEGGPEEESAGMKARLLAYPHPARGHLLCLPQSDTRYAVADPITPFFFPGTDVPIAWEVPLVRLDRTDPVYRLPLPTLRQDPPGALA